MDIELYGFFSKEAKQERYERDENMPVSCMYLGEYGGEIEITAVFAATSFKNLEDCIKNNDYNWKDVEYVGVVVKYLRSIYS